MIHSSSEGPKVTVLMPLFQNNKYLKDAIDSILNQTFRDFELLIICDDPIDDVKGLLERYQKIDGRMRIYYQSRQGLVASLNKGCHLARGEYIARMDADDISLPHRLQMQVAFLDGHPEVGIVGGWALVYNDEKKTDILVKVPETHGFIKWKICFFCPMIHPTVMFRREIVNRAGGYSPEKEHAEDYDLWRRLSFSTSIYNLQEVLLYLRKHEVSVSSMHSMEQREASIEISRLMISDVLGEEVSLDLVRSLWDKKYDTSRDVLQISMLIHRLSQAITSDDTLSAYEKNLVYKDAAIKLCFLVRPHIFNLEMLKVLGWACRLDPLVLIRAANLSVRYRLKHIVS
jgi:glycosyltransferase involved in cell wall biosynthesis